MCGDDVVYEGLEAGERVMANLLYELDVADEVYADDDKGKLCRNTAAAPS